MSHSSNQSPAAVPSVTKGQIVIVGVVVFGAFLALLNQTVMSPALPIIMTDFGIDATTAQWIMSVYPLVSGIMVPVSGFLIDRFPTRSLFFASIIVFMGGTLVCALAPGFEVLLLGRVLQAAGSGVLLPLVAVVPMIVFPKERRGTAMGLAGIVMAAGPAVGPVVGGAIIDSFGWRAVLGCIVPLAAIVLVCGIVMLKNVGELKHPRLDIVSVVLSTVSFGGLLYGFSNASSFGWVSVAVLAPVAAGVLALVAFVRRQNRLEEPLLRIQTLKTPDFRIAAIVVTLINASALVTNTTLPILLQTALGASAMDTGLVMLPAALAGLVVSPLSGIAFDRFGPRAMSIAGMAMMVGSMLALSQVGTGASLAVVAALCAVQACGQGLANMPVNTWGVNALQNDLIAHGNAIANTGRQVAGGLATALIVTLMTSVAASNAANGLQVSTAQGVGAAYLACASIAAVALVLCIAKVRSPKKKQA